MQFFIYVLCYIDCIAIRDVRKRRIFVCAREKLLFLLFDSCPLFSCRVKLPIEIITWLLLHLFSKISWCNSRTTSCVNFFLHQISNIHDIKYLPFILFVALQIPVNMWLKLLSIYLKLEINFKSIFTLKKILKFQTFVWKLKTLKFCVLGIKWNKLLLSLFKIFSGLK
jgi:hypothetical protein